MSNSKETMVGYREASRFLRELRGNLTILRCWSRINLCSKFLDTIKLKGAINTMTFYIACHSRDREPTTVLKDNIARGNGVATYI